MKKLIAKDCIGNFEQSLSELYRFLVCEAAKLAPYNAEQIITDINIITTRTLSSDGCYTEYITFSDGYIYTGETAQSMAIDHFAPTNPLFSELDDGFKISYKIVIRDYKANVYSLILDTLVSEKARKWTIEDSFENQRSKTALF